MNTDEEEKEETQALGVSAFLPAPAALALVRAAEKAKRYAEFSVRRLEVVDEAICKVRREYPEYFRKGRRDRQ